MRWLDTDLNIKLSFKVRQLVDGK